MSTRPCLSVMSVYILISNGMDAGVSLLRACHLHIVSEPTWILLHF